MSRDEHDRYEEITFLAGLFGAHLTRDEALSTDEMRRGLEDLREAAARLSQVDPHFSQGNLFEYVEAARFNSDAAEAGEGFRAHVTAEQDPHAAADIRVEHEGAILREVQAKSYQDGADAARALHDPAYTGMDRLVPKDTYEQVDAAWEDPHDGSRLMGELEYDGVTSGGTTHAEAQWAATDPDSFADTLLTQEILEEATAAAGAAGATGAIIGAITSMVSKRSGQVAADLARLRKRALSAGARGAATGGLGATMRNAGVAQGLGLDPLLSSTIASGSLGLGMVLFDLANKRIDTNQALVRAGKIGFRTLVVGYGVRLGAAFGVAGAPLVGAIMGAWAATAFSSAAQEAIRTQLVIEAALRRMEEAHAVAAQRLAAYRQALDAQLTSLLAARRAQLETLLDRTQNAQDPRQRLQELAKLAGLVGTRLRFKTQEEFDRFIARTNGPLII